MVRGRPRDYLARHPNGGDALLVVEIAQTSQDRDRAKATDYVRGAVPVYWLLDIAARTLDEHTAPDIDAGRYRSVTVLSATDEVGLPGLDTRWIVSSMLP